MLTMPLDGTWKACGLKPGEGERLKLFMLPKLYTAWFGAEVPGDIHTDLHRAGRIPDPYILDNLEKCRWTHDKEWWFFTFIPYDVRFKNFSNFELLFDGVDGIAEAWLNGEYLGRMDNSFRRFRFDAGAVVEPKGSSLVVRIHAWNEDKKAFAAQHEYWASQDPARVFFRRPQYQTGWDWAPDFPSVGISGNVTLVAHNGVYLDGVHVVPKVNGEVLVQADVHGSPRDGNVECILEGHGAGVRHTRALDGNRTFASLLIENPQVWWPNGIGPQPLYHCTVRLYEAGAVVDEQTVRFGIREIADVEKHVSNDALSWHLTVNGKAIFCKGANIVPFDLFPGAITRQCIRSLCGRIREAGFTMVRIWAGGVYGPDYFYDCCDELGILVWQDFAFANADYPLDREDWRRSVREELSWQVRRLRNHPSLAVWCGCNEKSILWKRRQEKNMGEWSTEMLFTQIIPGVLWEHDGTRPYVESSPHSRTGRGNDPSSGNSHTSSYLTSYFADSFNLRECRKYLRPENSISSFISEMFIMGSPCLKTLERMLTRDHLWPPDDIWAYRFMCAPEFDGGERKPFYRYHLEGVKALYGVEPAAADEFVAYSQMLQYELSKEEFEHALCFQNRCGGFLFWMLNDCWPIGTWSMIDYYGVPKPVYYAFKRLCAPLIAAVTVDGDDYCAYAANTSPVRRAGCLNLEYRTPAGVVHESYRFGFTAEPFSSVMCLRIPRTQWSKKSAFVHLTAESDGTTMENFFYPATWELLRLKDPGLTIRVGPVMRDEHGYRAEVTVAAGSFARFVHVNLEPAECAVFSDNFFDLVEGSEKKVIVGSSRHFSAHDITVAHLLTRRNEAGGRGKEHSAPVEKPHEKRQPQEGCAHARKEGEPV